MDEALTPAYTEAAAERNRTLLQTAYTGPLSTGKVTSQIVSQVDLLRLAAATRFPEDGSTDSPVIVQRKPTATPAVATTSTTVAAAAPASTATPTPTPPTTTAAPAGELEEGEVVDTPPQPPTESARKRKKKGKHDKQSKVKVNDTA